MRSETLTVFFRLFPYLVGHYFFILIIAVGYWCLPRYRFFRELAVLVPLSTLLNGVIKNIFRIPRPTAVTHLVAIHDPFGFPSGDVQIATVFWGLLFLNIKSRLGRALCLLPIIGISISRVYLGVHRLEEVLVGMAVGALTILIWIRLVRDFLWRLSLKPYFIIVLPIVISYLFVSYDLPYTPMFAMSVGSLAGLALCWPLLINDEQQPIKLLPSLISLVAILAIVTYIPIGTGNYTSLFIVALKLFVVIVSIFKMIPLIVRTSYLCLKK